MTPLKGKTLFITGGSRGIGRAIALRAAAEGANIAIAAKTNDPDPKLPGTIHTVAAEIEAAGGKALPLVVDVRDADRIEAAVAETVAAFGGIDAVVNNASAIQMAGILEVPPKRFDLMMSINPRGTYATTRACLPHLVKAANPHVLTLSPPLNLNPAWFGVAPAYALSKYGMTMVTLGVAEAFRTQGVAANTLWPATTIATEAIRIHFPDRWAGSRLPEIMADAAIAILTTDSRTLTGQSLIDEEVLASRGMTDFSSYAVTPGASLARDIFLD
jgi:citronellol/citronellal dehydrogenase